MRLVSLRLKNIRSYEERQFEFVPTGLIGILGPNGSGKSTIGNSFYAAVTNDMDRFADVRKGVIREMADEKDPAQIDATLHHGEAEFHVTRKIRPAGQEFWITGDEKHLTKDLDIRAKLDGILGVPQQFLDSQVFVHQREIFKFLLDPPAERAKLFAYCCNTERAEQIWNEAGEQLEKARSIPVPIDNRSELQDELSSRRQQITDSEQALELAQQQLLSEETIQQYRAISDQYEQLLSVTLAYRDAKARLATVEADDARHFANLSKGTTERGKLQEAADHWRPLVGEAKAITQQWTAYHQYQNRLANVNGREAALNLASNKLPPQPDEPEGYLEGWESTLTRELTVCQEKLAASHNRLKQLRSTGVTACPTCGTPVAEISLKEDEANIKRLPATINTLIDTKAAYKAFEQAHAKWESMRQGRERQLAILVAERQATQAQAVEKPSISEAQAKNVVAKDLESYSAFIAYDRDVYQTLQKRSAQSAATLAELKTQIQSLATRGKSLKIEKVTVDAARDALHAAATAKAEVQAHASVLEMARSAATRLEKQLDQVTAALDRAAKRTSWITRLEAIRDKSHRNVWPRQVVQNYLYLLEDDMNQVLDAFGPPFRGEVGENLEFAVRFPGSPVTRKPTQMSDGQLMLLALSVRVAILSRTGLGLMCLDEPTAGLDHDNVGYLIDAIGTIGQMARQRHMQIVMVTHDERFLPVFDQVIRL